MIYYILLKTDPLLKLQVSIVACALVRDGMPVPLNLQGALIEALRSLNYSELGSQGYDIRNNDHYTNGKSLQSYRMRELFEYDSVTDLARRNATHFVTNPHKCFPWQTLKDPNSQQIDKKPSNLLYRYGLFTIGAVVLTWLLRRN